ncbi:MAG: hypothetical protein RIC04_00430 [Parvibaculum sp.]|uniref:hypothetical protein n=1 Tax=Parvibaculum sp. TaxID=2024848 RepID=UPI0032EE743F
MVTIAGGIILALLVLVFLPSILRLLGWATVIAGALALVGFVYLLGIISPDALTGLLFLAALFAAARLLIGFLPRSWDDAQRKPEGVDRPAPGSREYLDWANRRGKWAE